MATVQVRFKGNRRGFYQWSAEDDPLRLNEAVLVEAERGLDFGRVNAIGDAAARKCGGCDGCSTGDSSTTTDTTETSASPGAGKSWPRVVRRAEGAAISQHEELRKGEEEARRHIARRAGSFNLEMRISDTEWQWDRSRLTVYFTAEKRVDFRNLVRELAGHFHARIDLRQIGVRDEAARIGGIGRCGREFCCSTWLHAPGPVNLALAKDQHLSLNPTQISGGCGRLLCCLRYEHEFYVEARKRFPKEGKTLRTRRGAEKVVAVDILRERISLRSEEQGTRVISALELRDELEAAASNPGAEPPPPRSAPAARVSRPPAPKPQPPREAVPPGGVGTAASESTPRRSRRRRRRRGGGGGGSNDGRKPGNDAS